MSKATIETTIDRRYLRNRTKDEIIEHVMRLLNENDALRAQVEVLRKLRMPNDGEPHYGWRVPKCHLLDPLESLSGAKANGPERPGRIGGNDDADPVETEAPDSEGEGVLWDA